MSLADIIILTLKFSVLLLVFALGLKATIGDATFLFHRPKRLLNALFSMYVAMPLFAVAVALAFDLRPTVKFALVALSIAPIPPVLPQKALQAGGRHSYAFGLLVAGSLLSIVLVPIAMELFQVIFGIPLQMTSLSVAVVVLTSVLAPLAAGIALHSIAPSLADRIATPVALVATILLVAGLVPVLIAQAGELLSLMEGRTVAALAAFSAVGLFVGHTLGGPRFEDRSVLALYTSARHSGVPVAIAQANFPQQPELLAALLLALLIAAIVAAPYLNWIKRQKSDRPVATGLG
jgi:bile acid:Na+ symporter, BASS family